jgi:hypothetical protein
MHTALQKTALIASTALSLSFVTYSAEAGPFPNLPGLPNLNFTSFVNPPKDVFSCNSLGRQTGYATRMSAKMRVGLVVKV